MELEPQQPEPHSSKGKSSCLGQLVSTILLGAIALLTALAYGTSRYGWNIYLELLSHFQVQYFGLSLIVFGMLLLLRHRPSIYGGLFFCVMLAIPILSWYPSPLQWINSSDVAPQLRLLVANVNIQNQQYEKVLDLVRSEHPDVAIFLEINDQWKAQLDTLGDRLPYSSGQTNLYDRGVLVYSNQPLENTQIDFWGLDDKASVLTQLAIADQPITLLATHPLPPVRPSFFHSRNRQMNAISQYLAGIESPVILAGDLNTTMWSPYYRQWIKLTGLHNARDGFGTLPTWPTPGTYRLIPSWITWLLRIPIDHCLISHDFKVTNIRTGADTGSDHKPLIVDLRMAISP